MGAQHLYVYTGMSRPLGHVYLRQLQTARHLGYKRSLQYMQVAHYYACMDAPDLHVVLSPRNGVDTRRPNLSSNTACRNSLMPHDNTHT